MTTPAQNKPQATVPVSNAPVVLRILLAILLLIPGIIGLVVLGFWVVAWSYEGFRFLDSNRNWIPLFIIPSVAFILFSVATVGIVLRFARWGKAPTASLALSITSIVTIVIGYQLLLDSFNADDTESPTLTLVASIVALMIISVPPFLHWWNVRKTDQKPAN
ncbi:MAG: hypothetical protein JWM58_440 [Rhizobium sp.]|nr:hypothetical protein [Rhizobium sp.]